MKDTIITNNMPRCYGTSLVHSDEASTTFKRVYEGGERVWTIPHVKGKLYFVSLFDGDRPELCLAIRYRDKPHFGVVFGENPSKKGEAVLFGCYQSDAEWWIPVIRAISAEEAPKGWKGYFGDLKLPRLDY